MQTARGGSDQAERAERGIGLLADHDMVEDRDADRPAGRLDRLGHLDIGPARGRVAGRMVVDEDDRGGPDSSARLATPRG